MAVEVGTVWVWLPGGTEPVLAAELAVEECAGRWQFVEDYIALSEAVSPDPRQLRLNARRSRIAIAQRDGLPGVVRDAMPAGYGADRLDAAAARKLSPLDLLQAGVSDSCGAIEVCKDMQRKLDWVPHEFSELKDIIALMDSDEPPETLIDGASTSVGGERPKVTIQDEGRQFLAKMQARSDVAFLPEKEFSVMKLANASGISTPEVRLERIGDHRVYLIERFDRAGSPAKPERKLYASAHTVLRLDTDAVKGDPKRSYLALGDEMRVWFHDSPHLVGDLQELWKRMAFNALVGNADDHPRNHGLLHDGRHWRLAPAFDITPLASFKRILSMSTGDDGSAAVSVPRLLGACNRFMLDIEDAAAWLSETATRVAGAWEADLRAAGVSDKAIADTALAFEFAHEIASEKYELERAVAEASRPIKRRHQPM